MINSDKSSSITISYNESENVTLNVGAKVNFSNILEQMAYWSEELSFEKAKAKNKIQPIRFIYTFALRKQRQTLSCSSENKNNKKITKT